MCSMKPKLYLIKWVESKGLTKELEYWDAIKPLKQSVCISVGFLIDNNEKIQNLAMTISKSQVPGRITIPCLWTVDYFMGSVSHRLPNCFCKILFTVHLIRHRTPLGVRKLSHNKG